ncbi:MAG: hypothetical protein LQ343_002169 [Gyalolechia ehrenbergii]|nr:MAG: hypothetical protein LQ343_002169 [Gyalolechia ehrenbergii]
MAVQTNGRPMDPVKADGRPNGHIPYPRKPLATASPTYLPKRVLGLVARYARLFSCKLLLWYSIITALFRCPSSITEVTSDSPRVCKPYLTARSYIDPYAGPYYDAYAAPYVDVVRPYMDKIEHNVYTPSINFGKQNYEHYGAPRVHQASEYGRLQWEESLRPALNNAQAQVWAQYDSHGAPYVDKAWTVVEPYYQRGRENMLYIYNSQLLPAYATFQPYIESTYSDVRQFTLNTALPYARSAWTSTVVLFDRTIWPQLRVLYGENVEPQLVRIGERLGRYRDGKKLRAAVEDMVATSSLTSASSSLTSLSSSVSSPVISETPAESTTAAAETSDTASGKPKEESEEVRQKIKDDLKNWQEKFAKAADKGSEDLEQRVKEIIDRQIQYQVSGVGEALFIQLEEAAKSEVRKLKNTIVQIVKALPEEPTSKDYTNADDKLSKATKQAGLNVKDRAQTIRDWKQKYDGETRSLVSAASQSTLEVIDNIRDLGLQEIGMRWAWMEGVTYKDWSKYHSVKKTFDEWRKEVEAVATEHEGLQRASDAAMDIESKGMAIAEDTAQELRRLKQVGTRKIQSADASDDFTTRFIPPVAAKQGQKVLEKVSSGSDKVLGSSRDAVESMSSQASGAAAGVASSASSIVAGTEPGHAEQASSKLAEASAQPNVESIVAAAKDKAQQVSGQANEAFKGTQKPAQESIASEISNSVSSASSVVSQAVPESSTPVSESASSVASAASKVYGGALAQAVGEQKPILDDLVDGDATYSEKMLSVVEEAGGRYADVTRAVSEALLKTSSTGGTAESVTSVANEQYSKALAAASSALYGTEQDAVESLTSVAADRYSEAVAAASSAIFGTPALAIESAAARASSLYAEASKQAYERYLHAKSVASVQVSGTPKPAAEAVISSIESAYAGSVQAASEKMASIISAASMTAYGSSASPQQSALSLANAKYSEAMAVASSQLESAKSAMGKTSTAGYESFLSEASQRYSSLVNAADTQRAAATMAVSEAYYGPNQGVLESISAVASSRLADSISSASAQYSNIKASFSATPTPARQKYLNEGQRKYYEAIGLAHERYSEFLGAASGAVYGTPTPAYQSMYSAASASLFGTPASEYQSMIDKAQAQYSAAVAKASENFNAIMGSASSAVGKTSKSSAQSVLDSASSSYSMALAAASASLSSVSAAASTGIYGSQTGVAESMASAWSDKVASISSAASSQVAGETPWSESVASQASQNWEALVSKASEQVYGAPTPWSGSVMSQVGGYAAQATDEAFARYEAVQGLFKELVSGREPDFTESVMNRLSSAYYTGAYASAAASASSYVSDTYASASSVVSTVFTPPASLEAILQAASDQVNAAVDAASQQYYGSSKGIYEQATSAAASSYSAASAKASEAVYGTQPGFAEEMQSSFEQVASSAQNAISQAIYGTTAATDSATSAVNSAYASVSSAVQENMAAATSAMEAAQAKVNEVIYGPEKGAMESASLRLQGVIGSAKARLAALPKDAQAGVEAAQSEIADAASSVSSMAAKATDRVKDEL